MKKLWVFIFILWSVIPAFAQWEEKLLPPAERGVGEVLEREIISHRVTAVDNLQASTVQLLDIALFKDKTLVPLVADAKDLQEVSLPAALLRETLPVVPASVLFPEELHRDIVAPFQVYMPAIFVHAKPSVYRGMKFSSISELKNILINGMELSKSNYVGEIYTSPFVEVALNYAVPIAPDKWEGEFQIELPVLVRMELTDKIWQENAPDQFDIEWVFRKNIPAEMISDVMVFLEINRTPGWYKVVLKDNKVVLLPVPGVKLKRREIWGRLK